MASNWDAPSWVDLELADAAEDLGRLPREIAEVVGADGAPTDVELYEGLLVLQRARLDALRRLSATGRVGLRAKGRAILVDGVLDGSPESDERVRRFARDVLRALDDRRA